MVTTVMIILVVFFAITLSQLERNALNPSALDLTSVRDAMVEKHGWSIDRADSAQVEYVHFLTLLQMKPGFMLVPWTDAEGRDDLDQFWHQHILDTSKYAADCKALFGRMIHHNPHVQRGSELEKESVEKTRRLHSRRFDSGYYGSAADSSSCAACAAFNADSGSYSSHAGHDGGSGGHDSGGHGCGGHGCGHGCGGGGH
jgi:hypothetical protein